MNNVIVQEMSYNNYLDADAAWNCVSEFNSPTCVIVKHTNPCGVASRTDILEAYRLAVKADPISAFGGIVAFNTEVDEVCVPKMFSCKSRFTTFHLSVVFLRTLQGKSVNSEAQQMVKHECFMK